MGGEASRIPAEDWFIKGIFHRNNVSVRNSVIVPFDVSNRFKAPLYHAFMFIFFWDTKNNVCSVFIHVKKWQKKLKWFYPLLLIMFKILFVSR